MAYVIGLDLGQANDFTAVSVLAPMLLPVVREEQRTEVSDAPGSWPSDALVYQWADSVFRLPDGTETKTHPPVPFAVRHLERWRGIPYTEVVSRVRKIAERLRTDGAYPALVVDATGVGTAVVDLLQAAHLPVYLVPVSIHGGDKTTKEGDSYRVPKRDLVGIVAVLLESDRLRFASGLELTRVLVAELRNFRVKIDPATAHDSYSAWRDGDHDDLVLSVALASWWAERNVSAPSSRLVWSNADSASCRFGLL